MLDTHARRFVEPAIARVARGCELLGLSPNGITLLAGILGVAAGAALGFGFFYCAFALLWFSGLLDAADGALARKWGMSSAWGTVLDVTLDRVVELSIIIALSILYPQHARELLWLTASIVVGMTIFLTVGAVSQNTGVKSFRYQAGLGERTEGFILFSLMILFPGHLSLWILVFLCMMCITAGQRLREAYRLLN